MEYNSSPTWNTVNRLQMEWLEKVGHCTRQENLACANKPSLTLGKEQGLLCGWWRHRNLLAFFCFLVFSMCLKLVLTLENLLYSSIDSKLQQSLLSLTTFHSVSLLLPFSTPFHPQKNRKIKQHRKCTEHWLLQRRQLLAACNTVFDRFLHFKTHN